jgi:hypothetical protein
MGGGGGGLESLLVLTRVDFGDNLLELSLRLALREVVHVVVLRRHSAKIKYKKLSQRNSKAKIKEANYLKSTASTKNR